MKFDDYKMKLTRENYPVNVCFYCDVPTIDIDGKLENHEEYCEYRLKKETLLSQCKEINFDPSLVYSLDKEGRYSRASYVVTSAIENLMKSGNKEMTNVVLDMVNFYKLNNGIVYAILVCACQFCLDHPFVENAIAWLNHVEMDFDETKLRRLRERYEQKES